MAAEHSLGPVVKLLGAGQDVPPITTSVDQAIGDTSGFVAALAVQQGKAELEAEGAERSAQLWSGVQSGAEGLLNSVLVSLGGTGLAGALFVKLYTVYKNTKNAVKDAVDTGEDLATAKTEEEIKNVKEHHAKIQERNGTKKLIDKALGKV